MNRRQLLLSITCVSAIGGLLFGYDTGVINGTQFYLSKHFNLTSALKGWVVGSALLGCLIGSLLAAPTSIKIGRKHSLILSAILFSLSAYGSGLPSFLPQTIPALVFFRILGGIGIGIASINAPIYIAEIAPAKNRGTLVSYYQLAIVLGFFIVFLVTYFIGNSLTENDNIQFGWRRMFWSELIPSLFFLILLFFIPKSPRWLLLKGEDEKAISVLEKLNTRDNAIEIAHTIKKSILKENNKEKVSLTKLPKSILRIIIIGIVFSALQQFTGINAVLYYGADIFENALGYGKGDILKQQILLASVNLLFTFIAMFTIDKYGRKPLLYIGSLGMIIGFLLLGVSLQQKSIGFISLIGILLFIGSFAMSMGPVVWVILSEIFPNRIRSTAISIAVAAQWIANYFVTQFFPIVTESNLNNNSFWNGSLPYFIFISFIIIIIAFVYLFIPETKGKSLELLEEKIL